MKDSRTTRMSNPSMVRTVFWNALTRGMLTCPVSELGVRDDQQLPVEYDRYQRRLPGGHDRSVVRRHGFCRSAAGSLGDRATPVSCTRLFRPRTLPLRLAQGQGVDAWYR